MKLVYIFPPLGHGGKKSPSMSLVPPVLEYLAGLTMHHKPKWDIKILNANKEDFNPDLVSADIVGISVLTHQAKWAYSVAKRLKKRGITVMLGGPHPTVMSSEAAEHADAVIIGEVESVMEELLDDLQEGRIKRFYRGELKPLLNLSRPRRDLLKGYTFRSFSTARGCPYGCKFCVTPLLHGREMRYRPINEVVEDIGSCKSKYWFSTDPDIWGPDVDRYIELFKAMASSLDIRWYGEANLSSILNTRSAELLKWARRSGLMQVGIGLESLSRKTVQGYRAHPKIGDDPERAITMIRDSGIDVVVFIMLGGVDDGIDSYQEVLDFCDRLKVAAHPVMAVPYPGTELRTQWADKLLYIDDWNFYDGLHLMVRGSGASSEEHSRALMKLWSELFTYPRIVKRLFQISRKGFPAAHLASTMFQLGIKHAFKEYIRFYDKDKK